MTHKPKAKPKLDADARKALAKRNAASRKRPAFKRQNWFRYQMKVVFAHFPMKISVKGDYVVIDNFLGEKASRHAAVVGDSKVITKGSSVTIEGNDREGVGQTAANLERATIVKGRDIRVFQDGIYLVSKEVMHDA